MDVSGFRYQQPETSGLPQQASIQPESRGAILGSHLQRRYTQIKEGEGFWSSLLSRIRECLHVIFDADYSFEAEEKEMLDTHHVAEHLGQGSYFHLATKNTIHLLQQMEPKPQSLIDQLTFAYTISKELFENPTRPASVVKKMVTITQQRIQKLQPGESIAIPSCVSKHSMMMQITCTGVDPSTGKKTYQVTQHNTGGGVESYHYTRTIEGKQQYQTGLEIVDISEEALCGPSSHFLNALYTLGQTKKDGSFVSSYEVEIKKLYEEILPQLGGRIAEPSTNPRCWRRAQEGGSCSTSCGLSLIRAQMPEEDYQAFKASGRMSFFYKTWTALKKGKPLSTTRKMVALDAIRSLEKTAFKSRILLPDDFITMRQQLEAARTTEETDGSSKRDAVTPSETASPIAYSLRTSLSEHTGKTLEKKKAQEAEAFLLQTLSTSSLPEPLMPSDIEKIETLSTFYTSAEEAGMSSLDLQRTCALTAFFTIASQRLAILAQRFPELSSTRDKVLQLEDSLHQRFRNLDILNKPFMRTSEGQRLAAVILPRLRQILLPNEPIRTSVPRGLIRLRLLSIGEKKDPLTPQEIGFVEKIDISKAPCRDDEKILNTYMNAMRKCPHDVQRTILTRSIEGAIHVAPEELNAYMDNVQQLLNKSSLPQEDVTSFRTRLELIRIRTKREPLTSEEIFSVQSKIDFRALLSGDQNFARLYAATLAKCPLNVQQAILKMLIGSSPLGSVPKRSTIAKYTLSSPFQNSFAHSFRISFLFSYNV